MKQGKITYNKVITFSRWSRKKYAVLASFGKQIKIGNVRIEICDLALQKSDKSEHICCTAVQKRQEDDFPDDELNTLLLDQNLVSTTLLSEVTAHRRKSDFFLHKNSYNYTLIIVVHRLIVLSCLCSITLLFI